MWPLVWLDNQDLKNLGGWAKYIHGITFDGWPDEEQNNFDGWVITSVELPEKDGTKWHCHGTAIHCWDRRTKTYKKFPPDKQFKEAFRDFKRQMNNYFKRTGS